MKKDAFFFFTSFLLFFPCLLSAQNVGVGTKLATYPLTIKDSLGYGIGFAQVSPNGLTSVGTFVSNGNAYIQTHTNTDLKFTTNDQAYQMVLQTGTGNVGIGSVVPTQKLEVGGNVKVNGNLQIMGGTPGNGKVLTSDASGNASWKTAAYGNTERFQFKMHTVVTNGYPNGVLTTVYNLGTAIGSAQGTAIYLDKSLSVTISKSGLYHFDWNSTSTAGGVYNNSSIPFTVFCGTEIFRYIGYYYDDPLNPYLSYTVSYATSFDLYITAPTSISFNAPFISTSTSDNYQTVVTGNLIAE